MIFVAYNPTTGAIAKRLVCPDVNSAIANADGLAVMEAPADVDDEKHVVVRGAIVLKTKAKK